MVSNKTLHHTALLAMACMAVQHVSVPSSCEAAAFECPSAYTLTSSHCSSWCTDVEIASAGGCIYYPAAGAVPCANTSVGYCTATSSGACSAKCLATSFLTDDDEATGGGEGAQAKALTLGLRGKTGSFGRSEPIEAIQNLALPKVTKLSIKDFMLDGSAPPTHKLSLLPAANNNANDLSAVLQTLELVNVQLVFPSSRPTLPTTLTKLVLNNNALAMPKSSSFKQDVNASDNAAANNFPLEIFALPALQHLDLRGNPSLFASSFTSEQLAFFQKLPSFSADFTF